MTPDQYTPVVYPASGLDYDIFGWYKAPKNPIGIIQLAHGMAEHSLRYMAFAEYLTQRGFVVCANDHAGHGQSVKSKEDYGYFGLEGYGHMVEDMVALTEKIQGLFPQLPVVLFGHSMGSFLARAYIAHYPEKLQGAVLMGTMGSMPLLDVAIALIDKFIDKYGPKEKSKFLDQLLFSGLDKNKKGLGFHLQFDWMTRDEGEIEAYLEDPMCGFLFTHQGFKDLCIMAKDINEDEWFDAVPPRLPILLVSGEDDIIGSHGKGAKQVYERLLNKNCRVEMVLYKKARHELLHEQNKEEVYQYILAWIQGHMPEQLVP